MRTNVSRIPEHVRVSFLAVALMVGIAANAGAADLEQIMDLAMSQSPSMQLLELNKRQSDINLGLGEAEDVLSIVVDSGDLSLVERTYEAGSAAKQSISLAPLATLVLPNDENTRITIGLADVAFALDGTAWTVSPLVSVNHVVTLGNDGDDLEAVRIARQKLEIDQGYKQGQLNFTNTVYQKIIELLGYEKSLLTSAHDVAAQRTSMDHALALRSTSRESATYKSMELTLAKLENNASSLERKLVLAKDQFLQTTGIAWESVESVGDAQLSIDAMPTGDASVVMAALDVEIAKLELAVSEDPASRKLTINGSAGMVARSDVTSSTSYSIKAGATLALDRVSLAASADLNIANGVVNPSLTVAGSWSNNASSQTEQLNKQKLRNAISIAELDYQQAMADYLESVDAIQHDILAHEIEVEQLAQTEAYDRQVLEQALAAFQKGLGTESAIEDAELALQVDALDRLIVQLEGRILENRIKLLQL